MKNINRTILIILSLFFGCLAINSFSDTNREIFAADLEKRKQTVDPVLEAKFLLMERGKIPIGECVDEAEDLAQKIIDEMKIVISEAELEAQEAMEMRDEAKKQIYEVEKQEGLIDLTSPGSNNTIDCVNNCTDVPCACNCSCYTCGTCGCCGDDCETPCYTNYCTRCEDCEGAVCPFNKIQIVYDEIEKYYENIETLYESIAQSTQKISIAVDKIIDLIEAENLTEYDPDRWKILNKLLNSRYKMEKCVRGFESALKHPRVEVNFLSCRTAMNEIETKSGGLVLLGYFENHISDYPFCYPYTANSAIRKICKDNRDSDDCHIPLKGCMDNYFCAGDVGPSGTLGGNKEGDEPFE